MRDPGVVCAVIKGYSTGLTVGGGAKGLPGRPP